MKKTTPLILIVTLFSFGSRAQAPLRWNFPCKPGTQCWNALTSVEERQNACQITGIDLATLSTGELLLITMEHPFFQSYAFHDSPTDGIGFALSGFNGYEAFVVRKDAMKTLMKLYVDEDFTKLTQLKDTLQIGAYTLKWTALELMLTDQRLLNQMPAEEVALYLKQIHKKLLEKARLNDIFGGTSFAVSALVFYRLASRIGVELPQDIIGNEGIDLFAQKLIVTDRRIVESLLHRFDQFAEGR